MSSVPQKALPEPAKILRPRVSTRRIPGAVRTVAKNPCARLVIWCRQTSTSRGALRALILNRGLTLYGVIFRFHSVHRSRYGQCAPILLTQAAGARGLMRNPLRFSAHRGQNETVAGRLRLGSLPYRRQRHTLVSLTADP